MNLKMVTFPVYQVPKTVSKEGTALINYNSSGTISYIDDLSLSGKNLATRRLQLHSMGKPLVKLKLAIFFLKDLIKYSKPTMQFIDSNGKLFNYVKDRFVDLVFREITKVIPILSGGALIEVDGEFPRYKLMYAPKPLEKFAGMLRVSDRGYVLYGLYGEKHENTRRKV